jgi:4-alpha-glucanotransferase
MNIPYSELLNTASARAWQILGTRRRAGVVVPLFSISSSESCGIGELPDLKLLVDWCRLTGLSIIQLLPMNDVGFGFQPYDAQSGFALDPMYLRLNCLKNVNTGIHTREIEALCKNFPIRPPRVDYRVKGAKLSLLWKIFRTVRKDNPAFLLFCEKNSFWLKDYILYRTIKTDQKEFPWESWPKGLRDRDPAALDDFSKTHAPTLLFNSWLQWQLFEQFRSVKAYAAEQNVLIMGDLPFLVSRDSADVWSHQEYYKLNLCSGAPPDLLYSQGQRWGMPAYRWETIARDGHRSLIEKLRYAENFYDLYRIDHVVGIFRVWTIPTNEPESRAGLNGAFDPPDPDTWEDHGRRRLEVMVQNTKMMACAEDLGTVPPCTFKVLQEMGIPGIDVQRWIRDWGKSYEFKDPASYRKASIATLATHDMSCLAAWWDHEAGTVDENLFARKCRERGIVFEDIRERLFDLKRSQYGRLRWRPEINDISSFLGILGIDASNASDLCDMYKGSFSEKEQYARFLGLESVDVRGHEPEFNRRALERVVQSSSIFTCQLLHDWLAVDSLFDMDPWNLRINFPGTISEKNWSLVLDLTLEDMLALPMNSILLKMNKDAGRTL